MSSLSDHAFLLRLAGRFGLPLFVYDADVIATQINRLKTAFPVRSLDIRYACKALSTVSILQYVHRHGCGVDAVSPGEIVAARRAGVPAHRIHFTPASAQESEYAFAIGQGVHLHVDHLEILEWLERFHPGLDITLRINPGIESGGHAHVRVGAEGSKFGFQRAEMNEILSRKNDLQVVISGLHMHLGSDVENASDFEEAFALLLAYGVHWKSTLDHIDLGGGFKVPYTPDDKRIDIASFGKGISRQFASFCGAIGKDLRLIIEPGKFLVSEAGVFLMEVNAVKSFLSPPMAYVQAGFNHFLRPMYYDAFHQINNLSNPEGIPNKYDIVGYLCETDNFALGRPIPEIRKGDVLCLRNAGAYGYTMASNYNARTRPAEVLIIDQIPHLIRRAENFDDLFRTEVEIF